MKEGIKKILLVCGCGIATSTVIEIKLARLLDEAGYCGKYLISKCSIDEISSKIKRFNMILSTVNMPSDYNYINAISFLNGIDHDKTVNSILKCMK